VFRFSTLTLLNSSDHDTPLRRLEPNLLICGVMNASSVFYISLWCVKRQESVKSQPGSLNRNHPIISARTSTKKRVWEKSREKLYGLDIKYYGAHWGD